MSAPPSSLAELLEQHAEAAVHLSRADQTSWSGEIVEAGDGILGLAHWDGTLHLDRECILDPLEEMYSRSGQRQSTETLVGYREALVTLLHEQSHFLGPAGSTQEAARTAFKIPGSRHLEEGVAEAWAHDHLDDYIRHLGIDKVAPGITKVRSEPSYAAFVPAVRLLTADLDRQAGLPPGESLERLNRQTAEGQWNVVVKLIYDSSRLPQLVTPDLAPTIRFHVETALRTSFKALEPYESSPRGFAAARSHSVGARILTLLHHELTTAENHFGPHTTTKPALHQAGSTSQELQAVRRHALSGVAPPSAHSSPATATPARSLTTPPDPAKDLSR